MRSAELLAKLLELRKIVYQSQPNTQRLEAANNIRVEAKSLQEQGNHELAAAKLRSASKIEEALTKKSEDLKKRAKDIITEINNLLPADKKPYFEAFYVSIQPNAIFEFDHEQLRKQLKIILPNAEIHDLNIELYQFLLNIAHIMYSVENNGNPEQHAYNLAYIFDDFSTTFNYLTLHIDAANSFMMNRKNGDQTKIDVFHDAANITLPIGDFELKTWRIVAGENYSSATFWRALPLAADIESVIKGHDFNIKRSLEELQAEDEKLKKEISSLKQLLKKIRYIEIPLEIKEKDREEYTKNDLNILEDIADKNTKLKAESDKLTQMISAKLVHLAMNHPGKEFHAKLPLVILEAFRELHLRNSSPELRYFLEHNHSSKHYERFCTFERPSSEAIIPAMIMCTNENFTTRKLPVDTDITAAARAATLGEELKRCCQSLNNAGKECVEHILTSERGCAYVTTRNDNDGLIGMCWMWAGLVEIDNGVALVIDSLEQHRDCKPEEQQMLIDDYGCLALDYVIKGIANKVNVGSASGISSNVSNKHEKVPIKPIGYVGYRDSHQQNIIAYRENDFIHCYANSNIAKHRALAYNLVTYQKYVALEENDKANEFYAKCYAVFSSELLFEHRHKLLPRHRDIVEMDAINNSFNKNKGSLLDKIFADSAILADGAKMLINRLYPYYQAMKNSLSTEVVRMAIESPDLVNVSNEEYGTALRFAVMNSLDTNSTVPVKRLLALGAKTHDVPKNNYLDLVAESNAPCSTELCELLIERNSGVYHRDDMVFENAKSSKSVIKCVMQYNIKTYLKYLSQSDKKNSKRVLDGIVTYANISEVFLLLNENRSEVVTEFNSELIADLTDLVIERFIHLKPEVGLTIECITLFIALALQNKSLTERLLPNCKLPHQMIGNVDFPQFIDTLSYAVKYKWFDIALDIMMRSPTTPINCWHWVAVLNKNVNVRTAILNYVFNESCDDKFNQFLTLSISIIMQYKPYTFDVYIGDFFHELFTHVLNCKNLQRSTETLKRLVPLIVTDDIKFRFMEAMESQNTIAVNIMLPYVVDLNFYIINNTPQFPIEIAIKNNDLETFETLFTRGAKIDIRDTEEILYHKPTDKTLLHFAVEYNSVVILKRLLEIGSQQIKNTQSWINAKDVNGCTALDTAIQNDNIEAVRLLIDPLLKKLIDKDDLESFKDHMTRYAISEDKRVIDKDGNHCTLLMYAAEQGAESCLRWMAAEYKSSVNVADNEGDTVFTYILDAPEAKQLNMIRSLIECCPDLIFRANRFLETFFEQCMLRGSEELKIFITQSKSQSNADKKIELIMEKLSVEDKLCELIKAGDVKNLMSCLSAEKLSVNHYIRFDEDDPAFNWHDTESSENSDASSTESDDECVDDSDEMESNRCTLLMYAAQFGQVEIIRALLEAGADVTMTDPDGDNVLVYALEAPADKQLLIITELLQHGADPHHQNDSDECLFDRIAEFEVSKHVCDYLQTFVHVPLQLRF